MKLLFWKTLFDFSKPERVFDAVLRSSFINLLARGFGYLKNLAIAIFLGFSYQTDGFFMALSLLGVFLIFVDVFDSIGVPNLVQARLKDMKEFESLAGLLLTFTGVLAISLTALAFFTLPLLLKVPFGFKEYALEYTKSSFLLLLPYLFCSFFFHHFGAVLRSQRLFTSYFLGEFIFSFFSFLFIGLGLYLWRDVRVIPVSFSLAQALSTLYLAYLARTHLRFRFFYDGRVLVMFKQFLMLLALYGVFHLFVLADRAFASVVGEKGVSALTYGSMLAFVPRGIIKFEHIAITSLSEVGGAWEKLMFYTKKLILLGSAFALFFFIFSDMLVILFFRHGAFTQTDASLTAMATRFYALSLPFVILWPVFFRTFQIKNEFSQVFFVALAGILVNIFLNHYFVMVLKLGIIGICLGTFFAHIVLCGLSFWFLRKLAN